MCGSIYGWMSGWPQKSECGRERLDRCSGICLLILLINGGMEGEMRLRVCALECRQRLEHIVGSIMSKWINE